jgi:hypothetical protein
MFCVKVYHDKSGRSGISRYEIQKSAIILEFKVDGKRYLYSYVRPGKDHVEVMKVLAIEGRGLTTYVNQHVRENYERRLS